MKLKQDTITKLLAWVYDKSVQGGMPKAQSAAELAAEYQTRDGTLTEKVNALIRAQNTKAAAAGFLTGVGGVVTLPVAVPANIISSFYLQLRMVAAIAILAGFDPEDDRVKALSIACLAGNAAKSILRNVGIVVGTKLTEQVLAKMSGEVTKKVGQAVAMKLAAKLGQSGATTVANVVPVVGGVTNALFDGITTNIVGNVARDTFVGKA
ncbi:EcsC family protein [Paenibacillus sp. SYP-B3998]|uniref:EcsC family protein n=1 Tax=Paenibacillus sp. SYP-B3998 TaxID=2678564 RepID=A0A6G4A618_9BACL|nr:EcsC family protein [Paenibacillus sp. SYP-B3998]NEW09738.1 EcsC family protein [Paenibacillus sp. SYP-B3998]